MMPSLNGQETEEEIANATVFLCSNKAIYITGQSIAVGAGFDAVGVGSPALRAEP